MNCPQCGADSRALETRPARGGIRRRRACVAGHKFTTYEYPIAGEAGRPVHDAVLVRKSDLVKMYAALGYMIASGEEPDTSESAATQTHSQTGDQDR